MNLFRKNNRLEPVTKKEALFLELIKETNEFYEDLVSEYETIENVVVGFSEFANDIHDHLNDEEIAKLEEFVAGLNKINHYATKSVRDVRDLLRHQKKALSEIRQEQ